VRNYPPDEVCPQTCEPPVFIYYPPADCAAGVPNPNVIVAAALATIATICVPVGPADPSACVTDALTCTGEAGSVIFDPPTNFPLATVPAAGEASGTTVKEAVSDELTATTSPDAKDVGFPSASNAVKEYVTCCVSCKENGAVAIVKVLLGV
jgi:hypothetical protein